MLQKILVNLPSYFLFLSFSIFSFSVNHARAAEASPAGPAKKSEKTSSALNENKKTPVTNEAAASKNSDNKNILYVFINPNGEPCKIQVKIIEENREKIEKHVKIVFLKTTEPFDLESFEAYGIRGLPTLVLANKNKEIYRFTPGIHPESSIITQVAKHKQK
jgi:thioredoxin 1